MDPAIPLLLLQFHHDVHHHHVHHVNRLARRRRRRSVWVRNWLTEERRREFGHFSTLLDLTMEDLDERMFRNYTRMSPEVFMEVLDRIRPVISKNDTNMRSAIEPGLKLAVTLRYLATGDSFRSLAYAFRVGVSTISTFLPVVLDAITDAYKGEAFAEEWSEDGWKAIADKFWTRWNMPHTLGALDGKHVAIKKPGNTGSLYHNYKGFFSIPLLALVDADYKFLWVEFGGQGHMSDAQIFMETSLREDLEDGTISRPDPCPLTDDPEDTTPVPFFIVSDDAFALKDYCMKPYSRHTMAPRELIFNYRLSRARRVVENAFGLLAQRFRVFLRTCELRPNAVRKVMKCGVVLHNILLDRFPPHQDAVDRDGNDKEVIPGAWRQHVIWPEQPQPRGGRANTPGKRVRELLADYFGSPAGIVPWQWDKAHVRQPAAAAEPSDPADPAPAGHPGPAPQSPPSSPE
eukprot:TRINITY_DN22260_c0_g2_i4.p1 TRINITY_DN22260_c0_g2~~TRINITY_DN22260_c0_g2_i4.p1  ORF type:complete len:460 (-),score=109.82 TRINITY_DN22260_c0_g2_i4:119-1498(-)